MNKLKVPLLAAVAVVLVGCSSPTNTRSANVAEISSAEGIHPTATKQENGKWKHRQYVDDFDGPVKVAYVRAGKTSASEIYIVSRLDKTTIKVTAHKTGCRHRDEIVANLIIDGERLNGIRLSITEDKLWATFKSDVDYLLKRLDEGRSLKIRFGDCRGGALTQTFDISGSTNIR